MSNPYFTAIPITKLKLTPLCLQAGEAIPICKSLHNLPWATFDNADNMISLANAQDSRYYKVNLRSYQRHGTIEFRQHSGTVNFVKICNWVRFLSAFIDESIRIADNNGAAPISAMPGLSPANRKLLAIFEATGTATLDEICLHMGWLGHTARSAIARLRKLGINITSQKVNGMAGYRLNGQTGNSQDSTLWTGIDRKLALFTSAAPLSWPLPHKETNYEISRYGRL